MTRITGQAVIGISRHALVFVIHFDLGVFMTVQAIEDCVIAGIRMTVIARRPFAGMLTGVDGEAVTEHGTRPARSRVTAFAGLWESSRNVTGIGHRFIRRPMTRITVCRSSSISSPHMATETLHGRVGAREWESCPAVVEYSARPLACTVASLAIRREPGRCMIRIGGLVVLRQVAADTAGIETCVPSVRVAGCTVHIDVSSAQRESRRCVVERGASPVRSGVAKGTILWEAGRRVTGVRCAVIAVQMTGRTIGWSACKTVVGMALSAANARVGSCQCKLGCRGMIEFGSTPLRGCMASFTRSGKTGCNVARICGPVKGRQMARNAVLGSAREPVIHVTL